MIGVIHHFLLCLSKRMNSLIKPPSEPSLFNSSKLFFGFSLMAGRQLLVIVSELTIVLIRTLGKFNINPVGLPGFRPLLDCVFPEQTEHESIRSQNEIKKSGKESKSDYRVNQADKKKPKAVNGSGQSREHIAEKPNSNTGTSDSNEDIPVPCPTHTFDCKDTCPE